LDKGRSSCGVSTSLTVIVALFVTLTYRFSAGGSRWARSVSLLGDFIAIAESAFIGWSGGGVSWQGVAAGGLALFGWLRGRHNWSRYGPDLAQREAVLSITADNLDRMD